MKKVVKGLGIVLAGFSVTLGIMYVNSKGNTSNEINSKQMAVFIEEDGEYKVSKTIPTKGYEFNEERSFCNNGAKTSWNSVTNSLKLSNLTKDKTSCMLYFDKSKKLKDNIIAKATEEELAKCPTTFGSVEDTESLICKAEDDFGESYYFRGKVNNNWVKFGTDEKNQPIWWRIIRINGDGTIRLIYAGTGETATNLTTDGGYTGNKENSQISTSVWGVNSNTYDDNKYVGYEWVSGNMHGYGTTPSKATQSMALQNLNAWFKKNLEDEFDNGNGWIDTESIFCNDRSGNVSSSYQETYNDAGGTGTTETYYGASKRLKNKQNPTFKCSTNENNKTADSFTYKTSSVGTQSLTYPVGLITADEVVYAGGLYSTNNLAYYLNTGENYWTMSPFSFNGISAVVFRMNSLGTLTDSGVFNIYGLRPVINLKSSVEFTGSGTIDDPYTVS